MKNVIIICIIVLFAICCEKEDSGNTNLKPIDTIELGAGDCFTGFENASICFDSVVNDSRCPEGATCFWEGIAIASFHLKLNNAEHSILLKSNSSFHEDTTIDFLHVSLLGLSPYPEIWKGIKQSGYKAKLLVADLNKLEANAQVIGFNAEKCGCCWGWTIKMENDTIKSADGIMAQRLGYDFPKPVNVYIELGELEQSCRFKYYKVNQIIKTK